MKIFVTGHRGYIGAHLVTLLKQEGHTVTGCDLALYPPCGPLTAPDREYLCDIRTLTPLHFIGQDCVMHLAALSNDPLGQLDPALTHDINAKASIQLALNAKKAAVPLFLFSSSCSVYGASNDILSENAPPRPQSAYAASKIAAEQGISALADNEFSPVFLRNATAFGPSPMLRLDLVVNNLLAHAFTSNYIRLESDGTPWRPLIHARDIARAFVAFLHAPRILIHNRAVNVGGPNYQIHTLAARIHQHLPDSRLVFTQKHPDPRNYRVNFDLLHWLLPRFTLAHTLDDGIAELHRAYAALPLTLSDFERYSRLSILRQNISKITPVQ